MTATQTIERPRTQPGGGSSKHVAHIVKRPDGEPSASAWITKARVLGLEVKALCGARWKPARDPERLSVCGVCKALLEATP